MHVAAAAWPCTCLLILLHLQGPCDTGISEDADIGDVIGVYKATALYTPSNIVYELELPVMVTRNDNSRHAVPNDMFRLQSKPSGAVITLNKLDSTYNLQNANHFSFRIVAVDRSRSNTSATAVVEVTMQFTI